MLASSMEQTRRSLIEKLKQEQSEDAWRIFENSYRDYILNVLRKLGLFDREADDVKQEVMVKLWKLLPDFNYEPEKAKFRTWLYSVIKNLAWNKIRKLNSESAKIEKYREWVESPEAEEKVDAMMDQEWKKYLTSLAMKNIGVKFSTQSIEIFRRALKGATAAELAKDFDLKPNSVNKIKNRVKESLMLEIEALRRELE